MPSPIEKRWTSYGQQHLVGRTIKSVRYMTFEEVEALGWSQRALVMELDNGTLIFPSADDEGNGAGALFGSDTGGEELTFPVI
jgi:hypothetical protein